MDARTPWFAELDRTADDKRAGRDLASEEIFAFQRWVLPTEGEKALRQHVFVCFQRIVQALWPGARCELFGSMVTGFYLPDGDFDVVVQYPPLAQLPVTAVLKRLKSALVSNRFADSRDIRLVTGARVPILKMKSSPSFGSFNIDVSFNSPKGPLGARESLRLLDEVEARAPGSRDRVCRLVLLMKVFLVYHRLNEVRDGGLGGLTIFCMVLSFVQLRTPVAPAEAPSAGQELLNFLVYYGRTFDVWNKTISTANGGELLDKGMRFPKARAERLSIVHPIEPERDLASGSYEFSQVSMAMWQAAQDLVKYPTLWGCDARTSALSLAGFRLSHAVIEQRALNQRLEADGTLARRAESWQTHMPMDYDTAHTSLQSPASFVPSPPAYPYSIASPLASPSASIPKRAQPVPAGHSSYFASNEVSTIEQSFARLNVDAQTSSKESTKPTSVSYGSPSSPSHQAQSSAFAAPHTISPRRDEHAAPRQNGYEDGSPRYYQPSAFQSQQPPKQQYRTPARGYQHSAFSSIKPPLGQETEPSQPRFTSPPDLSPPYSGVRRMPALSTSHEAATSAALH